MKLSTRSRYACRALVSMARAHAAGRQVQLKDVASEQDISADYLAQLISVLRSAGLVSTQRGTGGGVALARSPSEVTVADVVHVTEGSLALVECVDRPEVCPRAPRCAMREVWVRLSKVLEKAMKQYTLADLARREQEHLAGGLMYYI
ncbi:MAG TPA: Rrf2 family transcriptional regulator [Firmicutes bacterium]|nr:Rrf2 family transcriptional regulator [Bacillota bacterium]